MIRLRILWNCWFKPWTINVVNLASTYQRKSSPFKNRQTKKLNYHIGMVLSAKILSTTAQLYQKFHLKGLRNRWMTFTRSRMVTGNDAIRETAHHFLFVICDKNVSHFACLPTGVEQRSEVDVMFSAASVCLFVSLFVSSHDNFRTIKHRTMKLGG